MSVQSWLESLRLDVYLPAFLGAGYDTIAKCAELDAHKLEYIGVTAPGHKTRILMHRPTDIPDEIYENTTQGFRRPSNSSNDSSQIESSFLSKKNTTLSESDESDFEVPPPRLPLPGNDGVEYVNVDALKNDLETPPYLPPKQNKRRSSMDRKKTPDRCASPGGSWRPVPTPRTSLQKSDSVQSSPSPRPVPAPRLKKSISLGTSPSVSSQGARVSVIGERNSVFEPEVSNEQPDSAPTIPSPESPQFGGLPTRGPAQPCMHPSPPPAEDCMQPLPVPTQPHVHPPPPSSEDCMQPLPVPTQPHVHPPPPPSEEYMQLLPDPAEPCMQPLPVPSQPHVHFPPPPSEEYIQPLPDPAEPCMQPLPAAAEESLQPLPAPTQPCVRPQPAPAQVCMQPPQCPPSPVPPTSVQLEDVTVQSTDDSLTVHNHDNSAEGGAGGHPPIFTEEEERSVEEVNRSNELRELRASRKARSSPLNRPLPNISQSSLETGAHGGQPESDSPGKETSVRTTSQYLESTVSPSEDDSHSAGYAELWCMNSGMLAANEDTPASTPNKTDPPAEPLYDCVYVEESPDPVIPVSEGSASPVPNESMVTITSSPPLVMPEERDPSPPPVVRRTPNKVVLANRDSVVSFHEPPPSFPPPPLPPSFRHSTLVPAAEPEPTPPPPRLMPRSPRPNRPPPVPDPRMSFIDLAEERTDCQQQTSCNSFGQSRPLPGISEDVSSSPRERATTRRSRVTLMEENVYSREPLRVPGPSLPPRNPSQGDVFNTSFDSDGPRTPVATTAAGAAESDDCLSDGGDFLGGETDPCRDSQVQSSTIPILPATSTFQADRKGYMYKHASTASQRRGWKKYWVAFDGNHLKYFSNNRSIVSKRWIPTSTMVNVEQQLKNGDSHPYRFKLTTVDRIYSFATSDSDDLAIWTSLLMRAIIDAKTGTFIEGGEMRNPDKEGFLRMDGSKDRYYFVIKKAILAYYNSQNDFKADSPITQIEMMLGSVKELPRNRLQLTTPNTSYTLSCENSDELHLWKTAMEEAISQGLGDDSIKDEVYENGSNRYCADCGAPEPNWASVNFGITLCKHCAGIHRMLTSPASKVRSLRMDRRVWTQTLIQLMTIIGNDNASNFWEWDCSEDCQIDSDSDENQRQEYIFAKYLEGRYRKLHPLHSDPAALNEALCKSVQYGDVLDTMQLVFSGADLSWTTRLFGEEEETPMTLAKKAHQPLQMEFLYHNGGDDGGRALTLTRDNSLRVSQKLRLVTKKGFLYKTGANMKEFHKRWFVLERGQLNYYESDKVYRNSSIAKESLQRRDMLSISKTEDDRQEFTFELATNKNGGVVYNLAAETAEEQQQWVTKIAKSFAPLPPESTENIKNVDRAGIIFLRHGATQDWQMTWAQLTGKTLSIFRKDERAFEDIDLRKVTSIKYLQRSELCLESFDEGPPFVIDLPKKALYVQGDMRRETEAWMQDIQKASIESSDNLIDQQLTGDDLPIIVEKCISFVATFGLKQEGIYRLSGQQSKVTSMLELFRQNALSVHLSLEEYRVHDVATCLKRYLRQLQEPLLTEELYDKWISTSNMRDQNIKLQWYQYLLGELPPINFNTLKRLLVHLARVAEWEHENKMNITNLASIFGPVLMNIDSDVAEVSAGYKNTSQEITVVKDLLYSHQYLFEVNDGEKEQERRIQEALEKIEQANAQNMSLSTDMLLGVYVYNAEGDCVTLKVQSHMTSEDLLDYVVGKAQLDTSRKWGLYEVILGGQLERPMHYQERVLDVTMHWVTWPEEFAKSNYLCVKDDYINYEVESVFDPQRSMFSELRFSEKKGFKKLSFDFAQSRLSYYKDARTPVCSWNIEDLIIYLNAEHKRQAPTRWTVTFIVRGEKIVKSRDTPFFGRCLCFNNKEELYRWLAAMMHAQHPNGLTPQGMRSHVTCVPNPQSLSPIRNNSVPSDTIGSHNRTRSFLHRLMKK